MPDATVVCWSLFSLLALFWVSSRLVYSVFKGILTDAFIFLPFQSRILTAIQSESPTHFWNIKKLTV